jgi:GT2 family glycosyltransferase
MSLRAATDGPIVYVDSGSSDDSVDAALKLGVDVVRLDMSVPFTAARARNAGAARLREIEDLRYIQFIDGDCTLVAGWLGASAAFLDQRADVAVVCGRRRERRPDASIFNRLCDLEWDTPIGEAAACGGDALMRADAFAAVGGYRENLIAGEEPELCLRLREKGWTIWRIDADMTAHDAAMTRIRQWWARSKRAGHAYAEVSHLHRGSPKRIWGGETRRALAWAALAPAAAIASLALGPWALGLLLIYPAQIVRLFAKMRGRLNHAALPWAAATVFGKFPEALGVIRYRWSMLTKRRAGLIEYK